jgi:Xaa-Pro aminopeptidase
MAAVERLRRLRREMDSRGMDALLITNLRNIRYLSGFTGSAAMALITGKDAFLITDFRYRVQVSREVRHFRLAEQKGTLDSFLSDFLQDLKPPVLGFESSCPYSFALMIRRLTRPGRTRPVEGLVEKQREVKDRREIALLEQSADLAREAFSLFIKEIRPGWTEARAALTLEGHLRDLGSDPLPFPVIVASGENSAMPHASVGERSIRKGEPIVVDFGATVDGYSSDMTRTICLGRPKLDIAKIYRLVYSAQKSAIETVRAGSRAADVDAAARSVIADAGYGGDFGHATGHGVGLDVHEAPRISAENRRKLDVGMVFTVEPGIYLESYGGVRLEDMVLVEEDGFRILTAGLAKPEEIDDVTS